MDKLVRKARMEAVLIRGKSALQPEAEDLRGFGILLT